jgi:hypothetical protein
MVIDALAAALTEIQVSFGTQEYIALGLGTDAARRSTDAARRSNAVTPDDVDASADDLT